MGITARRAGPATGLEAVLSRTRAAAEIDALRGQVRAAVLVESPCIREPHFQRLSTGDVAVVFEQCGALFFGGSVRAALGDRRLTFRLSTRATRRGGSLRVWRPRDAGAAAPPERYELSVSTTPLYESFRGRDRPIRIVGQPCLDRLDALQRIVEHEMVHAVEQLLWSETACAGERFQSIARRTFGHTEHTHALLAPHDRATELGLAVGRPVAFDFDGVRYEGILNRVTKRATVLVPHAEGRLMSDGRRHRRFYVPLDLLRAA